MINALQTNRGVLRTGMLGREIIPLNSSVQEVSDFPVTDKNVSAAPSRDLLHWSGKVRAIKVEELADAVLGGFNLAVDPIGRKIDKECRNFGQ